MDKELALHIGACAREARQALELTQEDTAERVGLSSEFYARIERGNALPSVTSLVRICATLGVTADTMLGRGDEPEPASQATSRLRGGPLAADSSEVRRLVRRLRGASPTTWRMVLALVQELYKRT